MLERPPDLADATIRAAVRDGFGLAIDDLAFLPLGNDSVAWTYRARSADGGDWFVKVRRVVTAAAVLVPRYLAEHGFDEVVAARRTLAGEPWLEVGPWFVLVYPFVDAPTGQRAGFDLRAWHALGAFASRLHSTMLPGDLAGLVRREDFRPVATDLARRVADHVATGPATPVDGLVDRVAAAWIERRAVIDRLVRRSEELGAALRDRLAATGERGWFVPCHADLHSANVLVRRDGRLVVVDWDETLLAPPERDLMFVRGAAVIDPVTDDEAAAFETGYGSSVTDPELIAWYRIDWAVQDLADFARRVLLDPAAGPATRARAAELFLGQFAAGGQVAGALAADAALSTTAKNSQHP